jgi:hypothetical protein
MIHPKAIDSMKAKLRRALEDCEVENNWPVFASYTDNLFKFANEVLKHTKDWLSVSSVYSIFSRQVGSTLMGEFPNKTNVSGKIGELLGTERLKQLVNSIIKYIDGIPRSYSIYFPLPGMEGFKQKEIDLSAGISIITFLDKTDVPGGYQEGLYGAALGVNRLEINKPYICFEEIGHAGGLFEDSAFRDALSKFKQFVHLGIARRAFLTKEGYSMSLGLSGRHHYEQNIHAFVFDKAVRDVIDSSTLLPRSMSRRIEKIVLNDENKYYKTAKAQSDEEVANYIKSILNKPSKLISLPKNDKDAWPIKSAIEWAFEASISDNDTVSFIQTCIGLEAILGDNSDRESLTEILADRCAYLIGTDIKGRKNIKNNFKELYRLRSKLVHGRAVRLHDNEKCYLEWGKNVLDYVILKEIKNLNIDNT